MILSISHKNHPLIPLFKVPNQQLKSDELQLLFLVFSFVWFWERNNIYSYNKLWTSGYSYEVEYNILYTSSEDSCHLIG